jgi:Family of unknown function (DUF6335)
MAKSHGATRPGRPGSEARGKLPPASDPVPARPEQAAAPPPDDEVGEDAALALPSSLDLDQRPSAARSGRAELEERQREHRETGPGLTAGDIDADWVAAYSVGDEAPGGDNPTPGQTVVEEVGRALGVEYADGEELSTTEKIENRDRHRWELDPASSEDYPERTHQPKPRKKPG